MSPELIEVKYALDTFYFLICGALVMWMAAGFTMLEEVWFVLKALLKS